MNNYLKETGLLNYNDNSIQSLIHNKGWKNLSEKDRILSIYNYVRDDIKFGYNTDDKIPASVILNDGYGQCNTKGILFMTLLRGVGIPCRFHGFTIDKVLQKGAITGFWYAITPAELVHSWVEIYYNNNWLNIEGFILDMEYLSALQSSFRECRGNFCGYGVATDNFSSPPVHWDENDTYIQKDGIKKDLGIFDDPDSFFIKHSQNINVIKRFFYRNIIRHSMNKNVDGIRKS